MKFFATSFVAAIFAAVAVAAPVENEKREWFQGPATYFYQNGNPGACGWYSQDSDWVVALRSDIYGSGWMCGKQITIQNSNTGLTLTAKIADECPTCDVGGIDLSKGLFDALSAGADGEFSVSYWF